MMDVCAGGTVAEWSDCFEDMFYYFWVGEGYDERIYIYFSPTWHSMMSTKCIVVAQVFCFRGNRRETDSNKCERDLNDK